MPGPPTFAPYPFLVSHPVFTNVTLEEAIKKAGSSASSDELIATWKTNGLIEKVMARVHACATRPRGAAVWPDPFLVACTRFPNGAVVGQTALAFHAGSPPPKAIEVLIQNSESARSIDLPKLGYTLTRTVRKLAGSSIPGNYPHLGTIVRACSPEVALIDAINAIRTVEQCQDCYNALLKMPTVVTPGVLGVLSPQLTDRVTVARVGAFLTLIQRPAEWHQIENLIQSGFPSCVGADVWDRGQGGFLLAQWGIRIPEPIMRWAHSQCEFSPAKVDWEFEDLEPLKVEDSWTPDWTESSFEEPSNGQLVRRVRSYFNSYPPTFKFRPGQAESIRAILKGKDTLAVLPTGAGKTLIFQFLAKELGGTVLVISPLTALMHDQVVQSRNLGFNAHMLAVGTSNAERHQIQAALSSGILLLLFMGPEQLRSFVPKHTNELLNIRLLVVDEAHCVSSWGHDFRKDFRKIGNCRKSLPDVPALALTATASPSVQDDIAYYLRMIEPCRFINSIVRPNLALEVEMVKFDFSIRMTALQGFISSQPVQSQGLVYCRTQNRTRDVALSLLRGRHKAVRFHGSLPMQLKTAIMARFMSNRIQVVASTTAFGMGINKSDVRYVAHLDMPDSIESYTQEVGRSGRDGARSACRMFFSWREVKHYLHQNPSNQAGENDIKSANLLRLYEFAKTKECRWVALARHFEEDPLPSPCGICDNCLPSQSLAAGT